MSSYRWKNPGSIILTALCVLVVAAALVGLCRIIGMIVWNAGTKDYRQAIAASMEYAESKNCMRISLDDEEPVNIRFDRVHRIHNYLVITPTNLPAVKSKAGEHLAVVDCGDGSTLEVRDAGERLMRLSYRSPEGKDYRYTLRYHTGYDGWDFFSRIVTDEYSPG